jgi:hypothetical protein
MLDDHFVARGALGLRNGPHIISIVHKIDNTPRYMDGTQTVRALHIGFPLSEWVDCVPARSVVMLDNISTTGEESIKMLWVSRLLPAPTGLSL